MSLEKKITQEVSQDLGDFSNVAETKDGVNISEAFSKILGNTEITTLKVGKEMDTRILGYAQVRLETIISGANNSETPDLLEIENLLANTLV